MRTEAGSWMETDREMGGIGVLKDGASSRSVAPFFAADDLAAATIDVEARQPSSLLEDDDKV